MNPPIIIGFAGRAGAGKDTAATLIESACGCDTARLAFADPLRDMIDVLLFSIGLPGLSRMSRAEKEANISLLGVSPRRLLQTLGTEWGRQTIKPTMWVNIARERIVSLGSDVDIILVTDVRFDDEAALIDELGGEVWLIDRDVPDVAPHISENGPRTALITRVIPNHGTTDDLQLALTQNIERHRAWPKGGSAT